MKTLCLGVLLLVASTNMAERQITGEVPPQLRQAVCGWEGAAAPETECQIVGEVPPPLRGITCCVAICAHGERTSRSDTLRLWANAPFAEMVEAEEPRAREILLGILSLWRQNSNYPDFVRVYSPTGLARLATARTELSGAASVIFESIAVNIEFCRE